MTITWTPVLVSRLKELRLAGTPYAECAEILGNELGKPISYDQISMAARRYRLTNLLEKDALAITYQPTTLPMDDYAICSDVHAPFHSELWVNRFLMMADLFRVKKAIMVGDLLDCQFASKWYSEDSVGLDKEIDSVRSLFNVLGSAFEKIYWCRGNHENRIGMMTDGAVQLRHLGRSFAGELWDKKISYSRYDKFFVGDDWMLVHPKSYRQAVISVARELAAKYLRNIINTHGHFVGSGYDKSGRFQCYDLGGLFDVSKVDYAQLNTTTHPAWGNGFGILRAGKLWHFTENDDWDYWAKGFDEGRALHLTFAPVRNREKGD